MLTTARTFLDQVRRRNGRCATEGVPDDKPDPTSGFLHEPNRLSGVLDLVRKRSVAPIAFGVAEPQVVEAEHADALAGEPLAYATRRG